MKNGETNAKVISDTFDIPLSTSYRVLKRWQVGESVEQMRGAGKPTKYSWSDLDGEWGSWFIGEN